jgi:hypothetical protein
MGNGYTLSINSSITETRAADRAAVYIIFKNIVHDKMS